LPQSEHGLLRQTLRYLEAERKLPSVDWDLLVRQARSAGLLARLAIKLDELKLLSAVPAPALRHLAGEAALAAKHDRDVHWEIGRIKAALRDVGAPLIFLKGAAYILAALPAARGRLFGDVDIMVPREKLEEVEGALRGAGWYPTDLDAYDERYYRQWMHQIPPMTHYARGTTVDVHHTIVARTTLLDLNAQKLFAAAEPATTDSEVKTLAPADMVLHSAVHLFNGGEFDRGMRDLDDLNQLLRHFGARPAFWPQLLGRAIDLDLRRPLFYALRYTARLCATPVPEDFLNARDLQPPSPLRRAIMDRMFERALRPPHPSCRDAWTGISLLLLYIRAHYLLMPLRLLVPHLVRKGLIGRHSTEEARPPLRKPH
jgi:hypothetical protein